MLIFVEVMGYVDRMYILVIGITIHRIVFYIIIIYIISEDKLIGCMYY